MMQKMSLIGRMGKDPETKTLASGDVVVNFSVATSEKWTDKNGEKQESTEWFNCTAYKKLAEIIHKYLTKGSLVYLEGKMKTRSWEDKNGEKRYATDLVVSEMKMLGGKSESLGQSQEPATPPPQRETRQAPLPNYATGANLPPQFDLDDQLPF